MNFRYMLSKFIPVPFRSTYTVQGLKVTSTWIQWRGRIWNHRAVTVV